jgi:predicted ester cyclase
MRVNPEQLKILTRESFERLFNDGDLDYVDASLAPGAVDHQEPAGTDFAAHLKHVVEGQVVACRSTMTGTHQGPLRMGPMAGLPFNGLPIDVPHMHFFRFDDEGRVTDLWHVWNTIALARQIGAPAPDLTIAAPA